MTGTRLATVTPDEWPMVMQQAKMLVTTGFLPAAINSPEKAVAVMMKGRELGVPPMYALSNIAVISGKPTCTAELMLALIYRDHGDEAVVFTEASAARATISYKRRGWKERQTFSFTLEDAKQAGLSGGNWAKYPAAMLRARCTSAVGRMGFPDSIGGMYTPEELGAQVDAETGEAVSWPVAPAPAPALPLPPEPAAVSSGSGAGPRPVAPPNGTPRLAQGLQAPPDDPFAGLESDAPAAPPPPRAGSPAGTGAPGLATDRQRETLKKFDYVEEAADPNLTREAASDLISRAIEAAEARKRGGR